MKLLCILTLVFLTGCGFFPQTQMAREFIRDRGAQAATAGRVNALWALCNATPSGELRRWLKTEHDVDAYNTLCTPKAVPLLSPDGRIPLNVDNSNDLR